MPTRNATARGRLSRRSLATDPETVARRLLGCTLVRVIDGDRCSGVIVETEAYLGAPDRAAHTFGGRRTPRNEAMYARAGTAYVYFTYGMHHCFNVVCGRVDEGVAVLIRALEPRDGLDAMRARRGAAGSGAHSDRNLCSGPAKLCQALAITRDLNAEDLVDGSSLFLERADEVVPGRSVERTARIGIASAGDWANRPLRWFIRGNPHVSRTGPVAY